MTAPADTVTVEWSLQQTDNGGVCVDATFDDDPPDSFRMLITPAELADFVHKSLRYLREHPAPVVHNESNPEGVNS